MVSKDLSPSEVDLARGMCERVRLGTDTNFLAMFLRYSHRLGITPDAVSMLTHRGFRTSEQSSVAVVRRSVGELGLCSGGYFRSIMTRAAHRRLEECPPEVGPQFCLQHFQGAKKGEKLYLAMKPIVVEGCPCIFSVMEDHGLLWLTTDAADNRSFFNADSTFLFRASCLR